MRYITQNDLERAIPLKVLTQLSNDDPKGVEPDWANIEQLVDGSEELIDGYLRARYVLPLDKVPTIVRDVTLTLTKFALYARRPGNTPEILVTQHTNAMKILDQIQKGSITLGVISNNHTVVEKGAMRVKAPVRQFNDRRLTQWRNN